MFRNIIGKTIALSTRSASSAVPKERWDMCVGVLVERLPIVSKKFNEIESEFMVCKNNKIINVCN
jgi:hypothetical protein